MGVGLAEVSVVTVLVAEVSVGVWVYLRCLWGGDEMWLACLW